MYNAYFGFKESPFSIAPDPRYLYMTGQHREALGHLVYGLNTDGGCILLTGEVGTGKTTLCRCLLDQLPDKVNVALVFNPKITADELLQTICDEFHIDYDKARTSIKDCTDRINHYLLEKHGAGERCVLIIDEAQNLSTEVLEQIRLLTNLETSQRKLLQIILLGQPELLTLLERRDMRQLSQRITARYHLTPLSRDDIRAYIHHRLAVAGQNISLFPDPVLNRLYRLSQGVPRLINIICDRALLGCYVENVHGVEPKILDKAANEVLGENPKLARPGPHRWRVVLTVGVLLLTTGLALFYLDGSGQTGRHASAGETARAAATTAASASATDTSPPEANTADVATTATTGGLATQTADSDRQDSHTAATPVGVPAPDTSTEATGDGFATDRPGSDVIASPAELENRLRQRSGETPLAAYQALLASWQVAMTLREGHNLCQQIREVNLRCLHKRGNLNSLLQHDRPAVLKLVLPDGEAVYGTLIRVANDRATLVVGTQRVTLPRDLLDRYWLGQYTLLWMPPDGYRQPLHPGQNPPFGQWLTASLHELYPDLVFPGPRYDEARVEQVKRFQREHALVADGVVGPATIMHLNQARGLAVPRLKPPLKQDRKQE